MPTRWVTGLFLVLGWGSLVWGYREVSDWLVKLDAEEVAQAVEEVRGRVTVETAPGLELRLWAGDRLVASPVALDVDSRGRVFFTRTLRRKTSDLDIRDHRRWMAQDLALETVEDKRRFLRTELSPERSEENSWLDDLNGDGSHDWRDLTVQKERVYVLEDTTGDGFADLGRLFVEDFHTEVSGVAGGIVVDGEDVFVAVAPDLWRLRDTTGDGRVDHKESISHGYGVHFGFAGHGMSGLTMGPDGRIYWSVGDIGLHVVDREGRSWSYPHEGAILRANPDGTDFEVFAAGLRNTHEFAFDELGNLIGVDNDGDRAGEFERIVYLVDGSDSGWRIHWQYGKYTDPDNNDYNVWMDEGLYRPRFEGQTAFIIPPVAPYSDGPTGMVYNPGTALGPEWAGHFFVAEFTGSTARSRVSAFRLRESGAGFEKVEEKEVVRGIQTTGMAFGPDGALYLADWLDGWDVKEEGRIWRLEVPAEAGSSLREQTRTLLAQDFTGLSEEALLDLLTHPDMRVRLKAQFSLAAHGTTGVRALLGAVRASRHTPARLHGLWGIAQAARLEGFSVEPLIPFLDDEDPEIRAQTARMLGDVRFEPAGPHLVPLLEDEAARVRFFAAEALGRIAYAPAVPALLEMLRQSDDQDAFLRHAGSLALARIGETGPLVELADHPSRALRIAAVVALRRLSDPGVARFLKDRDEYVVTEAARAVHDDDSIEEALPELAALLDEDRFSEEALLRRAVSAAFRLGTPEQADRLGRLAGRKSVPEAMRTEALASLGAWPEPSVFDRVDGRYRGSRPRDPAVPRQAVASVLPGLLKEDTDAVRVAAARTAGRLRLRESAPRLQELVSTAASDEVRVAALEALHGMRDDRILTVVETALADSSEEVRAAAQRIIPELDLPPSTVAELLGQVLIHGSIRERQEALDGLGRIDRPEAHKLLEEWFDRYLEGRLPWELELNLLEAVERGGSEELRRRLQAHHEAVSQEDPLYPVRPAMRGGDVRSGRRIFFQHPSAECVRCHAVDGRGGQVAPDLAGVGSRSTREELLQALVDPSARITPGYGYVSLELVGGSTVHGFLKSESADHLELDSGEGETRTIPRSSIRERHDAPSTMPPMGSVLSRRELRDLVEFLSTLE